jgi:hypothetical protein
MTRAFIVRKQERAFVMVMVLCLTTAMMVLALVSLDQSYESLDVSTGASASSRALFIAEAGSSWGAQELAAAIYPYGSAGSVDLTVIKGFPKLAINDSMCTADEDCSKYYYFTHNGPVEFGEGTYRVGVTCYPTCDVDPQKITAYELRSQGILYSGLTATVLTAYAPKR